MVPEQGLEGEHRQVQRRLKPSPVHGDRNRSPTQTKARLVEHAQAQAQEHQDRPDVSVVECEMLLMLMRTKVH